MHYSPFKGITFAFHGDNFLGVDNRVLQTYNITSSYLPCFKKRILTPFNGQSTSKINELSKSKQTRMGASNNFFFNKSRLLDMLGIQQKSHSFVKSKKGTTILHIHTKFQ
jgi:hypothetical protein